MVNRFFGAPAQNNGLQSDPQAALAASFLQQLYTPDKVTATKVLTQQCDKHVAFDSIAISLTGLGNVMRLLLLLPTLFDKVVYTMTDVAETSTSSKGHHVATVDGTLFLRLRVPWILRRLSWFNSMLWLVTGQQQLRMLHKLHYNSQGRIVKIEQLITVRDLLEAIPAVSLAYRALIRIISTLWGSPVTSVGVGWLQNALGGKVSPHTA